MNTTRSAARKLFCLFASAWLAVASGARADRVEMQNGDRYIGKVTLGEQTLTVENENLGVIKVPRSRVTAIVLGTNVVGLIAPAAVSPGEEIPASLKKLASQTNLIQQVQSKFLADAGPEANEKFNELLAGLVSGKLSINDLRAEARKAAIQVREMRDELDQETGASLDMYLSILDSFLKERPAAGTNAPIVTPKQPRTLETD